MSKDIETIAAVLTSYQDALNASNSDRVMALYAPNGVCMLQHRPASVGSEAIRQAYSEVFLNRTLRVKFTIEEVVPTNADWAFARATSAGTSTTEATEERAQSTQELFVFQKIDYEWKIARHCLCTTDAPE